MSSRQALGLLGSWLCAAVALLACTPNPAPPELASYASEQHGLALSYPSRLYLQEQRSDAAPRLGLVLVEDEPLHRAYLAGAVSEPMESPPMITIDVYANPEGLGAAEWVDGNTNWILADKHPRRLRTGGHDYLVFYWDGLYAGQSAVATAPGFTYVFSVTWIGGQDRLVADFTELLGRARLTGTT